MTTHKVGLSVARYFTNGEIDPLDDVTYVKRSTRILRGDGSVVFELNDYECPLEWSQQAGDIASSKYFVKGGIDGDPSRRETSVRDMVDRVVFTITTAGIEFGYFASPSDMKAFSDELSHILINQLAAFNSPVWFNYGLFHRYNIHRKGSAWRWNDEKRVTERVAEKYEYPTGSACFIQSLGDSLNSIFDTLKNESMIFSGGAGSGINYSRLRGEKEKLSLGGTSSGLLSFLRVFDTAAGATKSGGINRRAARMMCLDIDHPEIKSIIGWKTREEKKAKILIEAGFPNDYNGEAYSTVSAQNANNSIRVPDAFMEILAADGVWSTTMRTTGAIDNTYKASELWMDIAVATWECGDPGIQYDTTINLWNTVPNTGRVDASNPCCFTGEMLVDTSEGRISFARLEEMSRTGKPLPLAFAHDLSTNLPVLRQIRKAWKAGETTQIVTVTTARGITLRCTPEHKFLLRNGDYVSAKDLKNGDRLRKVAWFQNERRSNRRGIYHRPTESAKNGTAWANRFMWENAIGPIPEGFHIHHKNGDPTDDRMSNFELTEAIEHWEEHSAGSKNARFIHVDPRVLVETWEAVAAKAKSKSLAATAIYDRMTSIRMGLGLSYAKVAAILNEEGLKPIISNKWTAGTVCSAIRLGKPGRHRKSVGVTVATWNSFIGDNNLHGVVPKANPTRGIQGMSWNDFGSWIEEQKSTVNDSVQSVVHTASSTPVSVYDIEVDDVHNFGVTDPSTKCLHSIVVSNSEYMHADDTACNLSSSNLTKFDDGVKFNVPAFRHVNRIMTIAKDIIVDASSYPTAAIAENSAKLRPLGIGYTNLGALLMQRGLAYDSDDGRSFAAAITSMMSGFSYEMSAEMARDMGAFEHFAVNREPMLGVIERHAKAAGGISYVDGDLYKSSRDAWAAALKLGKEHGYRNSQISVLAPTGTISFLMDADTTGIEPDYALVKDKLLAGGGWMKIINQTISPALRLLGYNDKDIETIQSHVFKTNGVSGCSALRAEHLSVFDCAQASGVDQRYIASMAHLKMMAAVQPFLSGAISKTVNCHANTTPQEIADLYFCAWKLGLKSVAIYRDGSKGSQPLSADGGKAKVTEAVSQTTIPSLWQNLAQPSPAPQEQTAPPVRKRLPKLRSGSTQEATIGQQKVFFTVNQYPGGKVGEVFITINDDGGTTGAFAGVLAKSISLGLQHGVPLDEYIQAMAGTKFEPDGIVQGVDGVKFASSITDLLAKVLAKGAGMLAEYTIPTTTVETVIVGPSLKGPKCEVCGGVTMRKGSCHTCTTCGSQTGCG